MLFADGLTRFIRKVSSSCSVNIPFADFPVSILTFRGLPLAGNKVTRRGMGPDNERIEVDSARFPVGLPLTMGGCFIGSLIIDQTLKHVIY